MTLDDDGVEQAIIDALRNDARAPVPPERSQRLASRLAAGAGIMGLTTSVTGATHAALASGSALSSGSALGTGLTLLGLTKSLLIGMGLGAGAGLGLYATFRSSSPVSPAVSAPVVAPVTRAVAPSRAAPLPARPAVPAEQGTTEPERPAPSPPPGPRANPSPELPRDGAFEKARSLAEQQALLDEARGALRRGDGAAALAALRAHVARFPQTVLDEEREAVAIRALVLVGRVDAARQREAAFERRFPVSLLTHSLRAALGASKLQDPVTGNADKAQAHGTP